MKLKILGLAPNTLERKPQFGFHLQTSNQSILLDCGPGTLEKLLSRGISPSDLNKIVISHRHIDHWGGLMELLNAYSFEEYYTPDIKDHTLEILIPAADDSVTSQIEKYFGWLNDKTQKLSISVQRVDESIQTIEIPHTVENFGFKFREGQKQICYLPDFGAITEEMISFCSKVDLLIASVAGPNNRKDEMSKFGFCVSDDISFLCNSASIQRLLPFHHFFASETEKIFEEIRHDCKNVVIVLPSEQQIEL